MNYYPGLADSPSPPRPHSLHYQQQQNRRVMESEGNSNNQRIRPQQNNSTNIKVPVPAPSAFSESWHPNSSRHRNNDLNINHQVPPTTSGIFFPAVHSSVSRFPKNKDGTAEVDSRYDSILTESLGGGGGAPPIHSHNSPTTEPAPAQERAQRVFSSDNGSSTVDSRPTSSSAANGAFMGNNISGGSRKRSFESGGSLQHFPDGIGILAAAHQQLNRPFTSGTMDNFGPKQQKFRYSFVSYSAAPPVVRKDMTDETSSYGAGNFWQEMLNPLDNEFKQSSYEMRQEAAYIESLDPQINTNLVHSRRLLETESNKMDEMVNPEWLELDNARPIKLCRQVLIPNYRYPTLNFVGRVLGFRGSVLRRICKKYKCYVSILGAHSTKNRQQEIELLQSGDLRFQHFASPLHIRIDVLATPHIAHMRMAGVLNLLQKMLVPNRDFDENQFLADVDLAEPKAHWPKNSDLRKEGNEKEMNNLETEFQNDLQQNNSWEGGWARGWSVKPPNGPNSFPLNANPQQQQSFSSSSAGTSTAGVERTTSNNTSGTQTSNLAPTAVVAYSRGGRGGSMAGRGRGFVPPWIMQQQQQGGDRNTTK